MLAEVEQEGEQDACLINSSLNYQQRAENALIHLVKRMIPIGYRYNVTLVDKTLLVT